MRNISRAALMAAGAAVVPMPRALMTSSVRADGDPTVLIGQIQQAVKEMREVNDTRLSKIESKIDPLDSELFARINTAVDRLHDTVNEQAVQIAALKLNGGAGTGDMPASKPEYLKAFKAHMRKGDHAGVEVQAAMSEGSVGDGGYMAPIEWDRTIINKLKLVSPIRENARVMDISSAGFSKLFNDRNIGSGWVGETASRPATSTPGIGSLAFTPGELYANPAISQTLLDDAAVDLEAWLANEVQFEFARQEGIAFLSGDGTNKPYGILTFVTGAANAARHPWGAIGVTHSGSAAALTGDGFIDLMYSLPSAFVPNAKLYLNRLSMGAIRKLKDGQGNYLWQPVYVAGQPQTVSGAPVVEVPDMPLVAAGNIAALYGDMQAAYLVVDRIGIRVLRDPFTDKPFVHFYTTKRVGGGLLDPEPMKALLISA